METALNSMAKILNKDKGVFRYPKEGESELKEYVKHAYNLAYIKSWRENATNSKGKSLYAELQTGNKVKVDRMILRLRTLLNHAYVNQLEMNWK